MISAVGAMTTFDLLDAVQPASGWFAIVGIKGDDIRQYLVETRKEADDVVARLVQQQRNVFFGVAKYKSDVGRKKSNVLSLKAFWLDIDCGPTKAQVNEKTGRPGGYIDQATGLEALQKFCKTIGLPRPIVVNSGRGLHVYWPLTEEVTPEQWEPVAARLRDLCVTHNVYVDPVVFETARILRVPGTLNFKDDPATPVSVLTVGKPQSLNAFSNLLGVKVVANQLVPSKRPLTALGKLMQDSQVKSFAKIMRRSASGTGCPQLLDCYQNRDTLTEARWFDALSVAKFCTDRDDAIHRLSEGHPDYNAAKTEQKIEHIEGPHNCATFDRNNPGLCASCPHFGKIKNPIVLGIEVAKATPEDSVAEVVNKYTGEVETIRIPEYPFPYLRGKDGGIWLKGMGDEAVDTLVYPYDVYAVKRMRDPNEGMGVLIRMHTPHDGINEFMIPNNQIIEASEVRKQLSFHGVMCPKKQFDCIVDCIIRAAMELQDNKKAETMRTQFGWADGDSKFIIGDREISAEGTYHSPPSSVTRALTDHMAPQGTLEKWKEVFNLYGRPGLEASAFAAATAFGAPLLRFSGQRGAIINLVNTSSGTGKTTILHMANSVWGNPEKLCAKKDDTFNSKVFKLGVFCNLPVCFDEMSNTDPKQLSELAYLITQGTGKDRMKASVNELRINLTTWQTIALCSSNHSFYEKLEFLKDSPQGEMMRILEYSLDYNSAIDTETGKLMFDHQLMENYGHAGEIYARYIVENHEEVKELFLTIQNKIDTQLKLTQRERFWSATVAANITGIYIAVRLKLCDWNIAPIFKWACDMIRNLRNTTVPPIDSDKEVLGDFLLRHIENVLIVNDGVDKRTKMNELPVLEPKRELIVRFEPDTQKVYITVAAFRRYCTLRNIGYRETIKKLKETGVFIKSDQKRMGKGMKISTLPVQAMILDGSHSDFAALSGLATEEKATEGAGSGS